MDRKDLYAAEFQRPLSRMPTGECLVRVVRTCSGRSFCGIAENDEHNRDTDGDCALVVNTVPRFPQLETTVRNSSSVEIDRSIDGVFRLTTDHMPEWSIIVVEDEILEENPNGVGTTFRTVTEEKGRRMVFQGVITRYEPPHANAVRLTGDMFDIETEFTFEDLGGRTRVTQTAQVNGKGFLRLIMFFLGGLMRRSQCKASEDELQSLKRYCEEHLDA